MVSPHSSTYNEAFTTVETYHCETDVVSGYLLSAYFCYRDGSARGSRAVPRTWPSSDTGRCPRNRTWHEGGSLCGRKWTACSGWWAGKLRERASRRWPTTSITSPTRRSRESSGRARANWVHPNTKDLQRRCTTPLIGVCDVQPGRGHPTPRQLQSSAVFGILAKHYGLDTSASGTPERLR